MTLKDKIAKVRQNDLLAFIALVGCAFIVSWVPLLHWPFSWTQTFFHEISHGLAAILTGGSIRKIELNLDGSGLCTSAGGIRFIVAFAGYAGAIIWGALLYCMVDNLSEKSTDRVATIILVLIGVTFVFWARDIVSWLILAIIAVPFIVVLKVKGLRAETLFMQFTGLYVLLDAVKSPLHLFDGENEGDGATLQGLTFVPEFIWVFVWMGLGFFALYYVFRRHLNR